MAGGERTGTTKSAVKIKKSLAVGWAMRFEALLCNKKNGRRKNARGGILRAESSLGGISNRANRRAASGWRGHPWHGTAIPPGSPGPPLSSRPPAFAADGLRRAAMAGELGL
jgi:hypothetical protein